MISRFTFYIKYCAIFPIYIRVFRFAEYRIEIEKYNVLANYFDLTVLNLFLLRQFDYFSKIQLQLDNPIPGNLTLLIPGFPGMPMLNFPGFDSLTPISCQFRNW